VTDLHSTQHEVWARVAWAAIDLAELGGISRDPLFAGLPWDARSVRELKRVQWSDYCTLCENIGKASGDGLEDLLESSYHKVFPELRAAFGALVDSKQLLRFMMTIANPIVFTPVEHVFEDLGGRRVRVIGRLRPGARGCETWFRGTIGALRGVPRHLDQPPAEVVAAITPYEGIYDILLPPNRTLVSRARTTLGPAIRFVLGREPDGGVVTATFGPHGHDPFQARLDVAHERWQLSPRQLAVLRRLAHGESDQEIANALGFTAAAVDFVIRQLLQKSGTDTRTELITRLWDPA